jgi:predicted metal-binding protein
MNVLEEAKNLFQNCDELSREAVILNPVVRDMCESNSCGQYGRNWACPPALAPLDEIKEKFDQFSNFIMLSQVYELEDSMDFEGMIEGIKDFQERLVKLNKVLKTGDTPYLILGAGGCSLCSKCTYPAEPCRRPDDMIISLEAYGIEVVKVMKDNGLKYNNGPNTMTYMGGVLY